MTWKKSDATPADASSIMEKIFHAHPMSKGLSVRLRQMTLDAVPKYGPTTSAERIC